jgi:hypothetical protein
MGMFSGNLSAIVARESQIKTITLRLFLLIRKRWILIALQLWSYLAVAVWMKAIIELVQQRIIVGRSWGTAVIILGSVALFTFFAGVLLNSRVVKERFTP